MTTLKTRQSEAERAAKALVRPYVVTTIVDTILCLDGTQIIGAYLSQELSHAGLASINAHQTIYIITPEYDATQPAAVPGQHPAHGPGQARAHPHRLGDHRHQRGQGHGTAWSTTAAPPAGICSIFSAQDEIAGMRVHSVFTPEDIPDYATLPPATTAPCASRSRSWTPWSTATATPSCDRSSKQGGIPGKTQGCFFYGRSSSFTSKVNLDRVGAQQPLPGHVPQLVGQGAAVHLQVVRQLLPGKGDGKLPGAVSRRLEGEIRKHPAPDGLGGGVEDPPGEPQVFSPR